MLEHDNLCYNSDRSDMFIEFHLLSNHIVFGPIQVRYLPHLQYEFPTDTLSQIQV